MIVSADLKVYLRNLELGDAESIALNANDPEIFNSISPTDTFPHPYKTSDAMALIEWSTNALFDRTEFNYAVCIAGTSELIGACCIREIDYNNKSCEIGYWIGRKYWSKGYGGDAVKLLTHLAFEELGMDKVHAKVMPFNRRSIKLLESIGFKRESFGETVKSQGGDVKTMIFAIEKARYKRFRATIKIWTD